MNESEITLEQVYREVSQLSPEEQEALIVRLQAMRKARARVDARLGLLVFDVGPWPKGATLRREDEQSNGT